MVRQDLMAVDAGIDAVLARHNAAVAATTALQPPQHPSPLPLPPSPPPCALEDGEIGGAAQPAMLCPPPMMSCWAPPGAHPVCFRHGATVEDMLQQLQDCGWCGEAAGLLDGRILKWTRRHVADGKSAAMAEALMELITRQEVAEMRNLSAWFTTVQKRLAGQHNPPPRAQRSPRRSRSPPPRRRSRSPSRHAKRWERAAPLEQAAPERRWASYEEPLRSDDGSRSHPSAAQPAAAALPSLRGFEAAIDLDAPEWCYTGLSGEDILGKSLRTLHSAREALQVLGFWPLRVWRVGESSAAARPVTELLPPSMQ
jgi:hypothetical protein